VVSAYDFIHLPKTLQVVYLQYNKLKIIPSDLFKYNPNLNTIGLDKNKIEHVGKRFFDILNLKKLKTLAMNNNTCTHFPWIHNGEADLFKKLRVELLNKCKPTRGMNKYDELRESEQKIYEIYKKDKSHYPGK
jgi:hypothetical protein